MAIVYKNAWDWALELLLVVYVNLSIIGAWQVFANVGIAIVGITFEQINIFS